VSKKKKKIRQKTDAASARPVRQSFLTPRSSFLLSIGALCLLWLVQFAGVLAGAGNLWEDVIHGEYPTRMFTRMAFFGFEFPHWNPFTFGGMPFFATGAGILYPLNAIQALLPLSDAAMWWIIQTVIVLHILIAGVNMFVYLRFKGRSDTAALFGATAFMFGGYMITHVIHSSIIYIVAWLPLQLLLLERGVRESKPRYAVIGGLLLGCVMQAGHAQVMFYALVFLLSFGVYFLLTAQHLTPSTPTGLSRSQAIVRFIKIQLLSKNSVSAILFFVVAAGLCLVQYLPVFEASGHTSRIEYTITDASEGSLQFVQLLTALMPKVFGAYTGSDAVPVFWLEDSFRHGYYNYWESSFYFGVSTLILSVFLFRKIRTNRAVIFAAAWILASFLIALGGNFFFYKILFSLGIPGFNSFRHTPRILFIWGFFFPVMAAVVLDGIDELKSKKLKTISLALCAAAALLGIITAAGGLKSVFPLMGALEGREQYASAQGFILLVNALLLGGVLILFFRGIIGVKTAKVLVVVCLAIDMLTFAAGQHIARREGADVVFKKAEGLVEQIRSMRKEGIFRVNIRQFIVKPDGKTIGQSNLMLMDRNQGYVSGIEITEGYNPFRLKYASLPLNADKFNVMLDLMNIRRYVNPDLKEGGKDIMLRNETCLPRAKLFYRAKVVGGGGGADVDVTGNNSSDVYDSLILDYMNGPQYDHRNEVVVTDQSLAKFSGGGTGNAQITKYGINKIELDVDTDRDAVLWLSEIWYPAWKATVNGKKTEVYRADYSFRAVVVPEGKSKVVFKFDSAYFNIGALISSLTLIAALLYLLIGFVRDRKPARKDTVSVTK